jgi:hypothetical protein
MTGFVVPGLTRCMCAVWQFCAELPSSSVSWQGSCGKDLGRIVNVSSSLILIEPSRMFLLGYFADRSYPSKFGFDGSGGSTTAIITVLVVVVVVLSLALLALLAPRPAAERSLSRDNNTPVETPHDETPAPPAINLAPEFQSPRYESARRNKPLSLHACSTFVQNKRSNGFVCVIAHVTQHSGKKQRKGKAATMPVASPRAEPPVTRSQARRRQSMR